MLSFTEESEITMANSMREDSLSTYTVFSLGPSAATLLKSQTWGGGEMGKNC